MIKIIYIKISLKNSKYQLKTFIMFWFN